MSLKNMCNTDEAKDVRRILSLVGDKWTLLVITLLGHRTMRFNEIRHEIEEISQRMLTLTLRQLERDGIINRKIYPTVPPKVEYWLTPLGQTLLETMQSLVDWTIAHREEIISARDDYDARNEAVVIGDGVPALEVTG
jgi:DNA-binding HxlR family transcriptional regulator